MTKTVVIRLECEEKPTVNDVLEYIEPVSYTHLTLPTILLV